jgi:hypothetical protein
MILGEDTGPVARFTKLASGSCTRYSAPHCAVRAADRADCLEPEPGRKELLCGCSGRRAAAHCRAQGFDQLLARGASPDTATCRPPASHLNLPQIGYDPVLFPLGVLRPLHTLLQCTVAPNPNCSGQFRAPCSFSFCAVVASLLRSHCRSGFQCSKTKKKQRMRGSG